MAHGDAVTAVRAVELPRRTRAAFPERDELVGSYVWQTGFHHRLPPFPGDPPTTCRPILAHTEAVQTPDPYLPPAAPEDDWLEPAPRPVRPIGAIWAWGGRLTWLSGLILAISSFTDWYVGGGQGVTTAIIGWHTGALGKLVFFIGLALLGIVALRESGIELPATVPESLVVIALGSLSTIFVLIRLISVPDTFYGWRGRGIGIFISLVASLLVIAAGLLRAGEEL
jgi:hypothetical protein